MRRGKERGTITINVDDIIGSYSGNLEVISYLGHEWDNTRGGERSRHYYRCLCHKCGCMKAIRRDGLLQKTVHSCGCERGRKHGNKNED